MGAIETVRAVRLREIIAKDGLSAVAKKSGRASSQLSSVSRGLRPFGERLARSLEKDLELPPGYFDAINAIDPSKVVQVSSMDFDSVPLLKMEDLLREGERNSSRRIVYPFSDTDADFAVVFEDLSMFPMVKPGDVGYFRTMEHIAPGSYVLAIVDGHILFRKLTSKSYKSFALVPENKDFPEITSDDTEIKLIARLIASYRRF